MKTMYYGLMVILDGNVRGGATFTRFNSTESSDGSVGGFYVRKAFEDVTMKGMNSAVSNLMGLPMPFGGLINYPNTAGISRGAANNFHRGGGGGFRGLGANMQRGCRGRGKGNRGGSNRGHPGNQPSGVKPKAVAHQRPQSAYSPGCLTQCYKCGEFGHVVTKCPQNDSGN